MQRHRTEQRRTGTCKTVLKEKNINLNFVQKDYFTEVPLFLRGKTFLNRTVVDQVENIYMSGYDLCPTLWGSSVRTDFDKGHFCQGNVEAAFQVSLKIDSLRIVL